MADEIKRDEQPRRPTNEAQPVREHRASGVDEAKKQLAADHEARLKAANERLKGRPTPTQEELNLLKLGHHVELSDDGSGPDPVDKLNTVRHIGGEHYQHRQMSPRQS